MNFLAKVINLVNSKFQLLQYTRELLFRFAKGKVSDYYHSYVENAYGSSKNMRAEFPRWSRECTLSGKYALGLNTVPIVFYCNREVIDNERNVCC